MNKVQIELIDNHLKYKELLNPLYETLKLRLKDNHLFVKEIKKEFEDKCKWKVAEELSKCLQITVEDAIISTENITWEKFLA